MAERIHRLTFSGPKVGQLARADFVDVPILLSVTGGTVAADAVATPTFARSTTVPPAVALEQLETAQLIVSYAWAATADGSFQLYDTTAAVVRGSSTAKTGGETSEWEAFAVTGLVAGNTLVIRANITTAGASGETVRLDRAILRLIKAAYSVGHSVSDAEIFQINSPVAGLIHSIQFYCSGIAATASSRVKKNGVAITAAITPVAGTPSVISPIDPFLGSGDALTIHVTTDGTGSFTDLTITIVVKEQESIATI